MSSRAVRQSLSFALALSLSGSAAWAQQINRGPMHVVGLRAPDGEVDAATALTNALREQATAAGYQVPNNTPPFDQEFAMVGCTSTSPECLSLIAQDIHAPKYIYGTVSRIGRGRDAQLSVEVSLWDESSHREIHRESTTIPRAQANSRPESLRELARQMFVAIGNRDMSAQQEAVRAQQQQDAARAEQERLQREAAERARQLEAARLQLSRRTAIQRSHVLRYVGFGVLGLGVVAGAVGIWQATTTSGQGDASLNGTGSDGEAWTRYGNTVNFPVNGARPLTPDQVCQRAATDASRDPDAAVSRNLCEANSTSQALAYAFGIGGIVLAGVGAALVVIDVMQSNSPATEGQPQPGASPRPAQPHAQLRISPILAPGLGGVHMGLTF
jgi:hypothetical protein